MQLRFFLLVLETTADQRWDSPVSVKSSLPFAQNSNMTLKADNSIDKNTNIQHYDYDPEVIVEAVPYLQEESHGFDGSYATNPPIALAPTTPIQESHVSTTPAPYAVTSQQYQQQVSAIRRRNCLIGGSISITIAIVCCLCCLLPVIIFLIAWNQMNQMNPNFNSQSYMHPN